MSDRPNILVIMSDQHHAGVMGCAGDPVADTPALDRLAENTLIFCTTDHGEMLPEPDPVWFDTPPENWHEEEMPPVRP